MTKKRSQKSAKKSGISHPGMMGDGTEEQNLNERGNPAARIKKDEVETAFDEKPASRMSEPAKVTYEVVEHDGGWAYKTFPTYALAHEAAVRAAREQLLAGETTTISYEDSDGRWHDEVAAGNDRPETSVKD